MDLIKTHYGYLTQANPPTPEELSSRYGMLYWDDAEHQNYLETERKDGWYWNLIFDDYLTEIKKHLGSTPSVVDLGCGRGSFVYRMRRKGIKAIGLDPAASMNPHIVAEFPSAEAISVLVHHDLCFDCMTALNVLEHILDPEAFITMAYHLLPLNGLMIIQVPYEENRLQKKLTASHGPWWHDEDHINYFRGDSLRQLMENCGFGIVEEWRTFPMELFPLVGYDYIGNPDLGRKCHVARMDLERSIGRRGRQLLRKLWVKLDVGREIILFGRKL